MNMDHAAILLASSVLVMLAFVVWVIAILVVNNLLHKYWKPIGIFKIIDPEGHSQSTKIIK